MTESASNKKVSGAINALCETFDWTETNEGFSFWADVCQRLWRIYEEGK